MNKKYCLGHDDSGHTYIFPLDLKKEFDELIEEADPYGKSLEEIEGVFRLEGEELTFENPHVNGKSLYPPFEGWIALYDKKYEGWGHDIYCSYYVTTEKYFLENGCICDDHIEEKIPEFSQSMESYFECNHTIENWSKEKCDEYLKSLGFRLLSQEEFDKKYEETLEDE